MGICVGYNGYVVDRELRRPADILDVQAGLVRWWRSDLGFRMGKYFTESMGFFIGKDGKAVTATGEAEGEPFNRWLSDNVKTADAYVVTAPLVDRISAFAKQFEADDIQEEDLPNDTGFVWLDRPLYVQDYRDSVMSFKAFLWAKTVGGVVVVFFSDAYDDLDDVSIEVASHTAYMKEPAGLSLSNIQPYRWGMDLSTRAFMDPQQVTRSDGTPVQALATGATLDRIMTDNKYLTYFLLAFWTWIASTVPRVHQPDRAGLRRATRSGVTPRVRVLDLRSVEIADVKDHSTDTHRDIQWTHRWKVRAHQRVWRCKDGSTRIINVSSYIKGPDGAKLVSAPVVRRVSR